MKTMKLIAAISLALIITNGFNALGGNPNNPANNASGINKNEVTYVVRVAGANYVPHHAETYQIWITDAGGNKVAPVQEFVPGKQDYTFTEGASVTGTRIARMVKVPIGPRSFDIRPSIRKGTFLKGKTYSFVIIALPYRFEAGTDIE